MNNLITEVNKISKTKVITLQTTDCSFRLQQFYHKKILKMQELTDLKPEWHKLKQNIQTHRSMTTKELNHELHKHKNLHIESVKKPVCTKNRIIGIVRVQTKELKILTYYLTQTQHTADIIIKNKEWCDH